MAGVLGLWGEMGDPAKNLRRAEALLRTLRRAEALLRTLRRAEALLRTWRRAEALLRTSGGLKPYYEPGGPPLAKNVGKCRKMSGIIGEILAFTKIMGVEELLQLADEVMFAKTGKHLDDLQRAILWGSLVGERYGKIAEDFHVSEGHVRDVGAQLWQQLSQHLGSEVRKSNFRATIERLKSSDFFLNLLSFNHDSVIDNNRFNFCSHNFHPVSVSPNEEKNGKQSPNDAASQLRADLVNMPDLGGSFSGRDEELNKLKAWIVGAGSRLVAVTGISGMGKTALGVRSLQQIKDNFEVVMWRRVRFGQTVNLLLTEILTFLCVDRDLPESSDEKLSLLMECLRQYRCLIVIDNWDNFGLNIGSEIDSEGEGDNYGELWRRVGECAHQSCFLILGYSPPRLVWQLQGEKSGLRWLQLEGLGAAAGDIFRDKGLGDEDKWGDVIDMYRGHPGWLNGVAGMIKDFFGGRVRDFLECDIIFVDDEIKNSLFWHFNQLSDLEKQVMVNLAIAAQPLPLGELIEGLKIGNNSNWDKGDLLRAMQSLGMRGLMERRRRDDVVVFGLSPVWRQYLSRECGRLK